MSNNNNINNENNQQNIFQELFSEIEIPDRLSPQNIAKMLDERTGNKNRITVTSNETIGIISDDDYEGASEIVSTQKIHTQPSDKKEKTGIKTAPTTVIARITITVAACIALVIGLIIFNNNDLALRTAGVAGAQSYDEVYGAVMQASGNQDTTSQNGALSPVAANVDKNAVNSAENTAVVANKKLYFIKDNKLYIDAGKPSQSVVTSQNGDFVEIIADKQYVYAISEEKITNTVSVAINGEQKSSQVTEYITRVDIYNSYSSAIDSHSFTQSGRYIKAALAGKGIILTTDFTDENPYPIQNADDKIRYIPQVCSGEEVKFIEASEILLPQKADDRSYGIVSYLFRDDALVYQTLAVLGHSNNMYTDEDTVVFTNKAATSAVLVRLADAGAFAYSTLETKAPVVGIAKNADNKLVVLTDDLNLYYEAQSGSVKLKGDIAAKKLICYEKKLYVISADKAYEVSSDTLTEVDTKLFKTKINDSFYVTAEQNPFAVSVYDSAYSSQSKAIADHSLEDVQSILSDNPDALLSDGQYAYYPYEYWNGIEYVYAYTKLDSSGNVTATLTISNTDLSDRFVDGFICDNKLYAVFANGVVIADTAALTVEENIIIS